MKKLLYLLLFSLFLQCNAVDAQITNQEDVNMNRVEFAQNRFNELFKNDDFSFKDTDTEFYNSVKNFVYGDVHQQGKLSLKERALITIVVLTAAGQSEYLEKHIDAALNAGVTPLEIKEAIYQTAPYCGIPKSVASLKHANVVFKKRNIKLPLETHSAVTEENRYEEGLAVQVKIFGEGMRNASSNYPKNLQHIPKYLSEYCFGDFYTHGSLDLKTRELLTLCMLVTLGDTSAQLKAHIQGNLNTGNDKETIIAAINQCLPYVGFPRTLNALNILNEVIPENK